MNAAVLLLAATSVFRMGDDIRLADAPDGAVLRTMGGNIRIERAGGKVVAKTMGGDIRIDALDGSTDAGTMGGEIEVTVIGSGPGRDIDLHSLGGSIEVRLPADFNGEFFVELEEDDSRHDHRISSDFKLDVRQSSRWRLFRGDKIVHTATGRTGSGANRVRIRTVGGNIDIRRK
jgi:DUF4097 and DUF4098 domain-containing protein YvlB